MVEIADTPNVVTHGSGMIYESCYRIRYIIIAVIIVIKFTTLLLYHLTDTKFAKQVVSILFATNQQRGMSSSAVAKDCSSLSFLAQATPRSWQLATSV